jgi:hypothetical protein
LLWEKIEKEDGDVTIDYVYIHGGQRTREKKVVD